MNIADELRFLNPGWRDVIEIAVVAYVLYRLLLLIQGTRALQMLVGIALLVLTYGLARALDLTMLTYLLGLGFTYGVFALLIIFQPELRAALAQLGQARVVPALMRRLEASDVADEIADAVERLAQRGTGALIAIERETNLSDYVESGTPMDATLSADLLMTIFTPYSPLHDGAVIVRGDKIIGAGCILPLSPRPLSDRSLGTRHRAAMGLGEETDALVVVLSEETSRISLVNGEEMIRDLTPQQLRDRLSGKGERVSEPALQAVASGARTRRSSRPA